MAGSLHLRLLHDMEELQSDPYPNVVLSSHENDITKACLVLATERYGSIHMTVEIPSNFPLSPPAIRMDSAVEHPNVFGGYICASILNTAEGYTPAYTLKGIAIQLLSFFSSDRIEQSYGNTVSLDGYRGRHRYGRENAFSCCTQCNFTPYQIGLDSDHSVHLSRDAGFSFSSGGNEIPAPPDSRTGLAYIPDQVLVQVENSVDAKDLQSDSTKANHGAIEKAEFPAETLVLICNELDTKDLMNFAQAWGRIGSLIVEQDLIRTRELLCFCLKENYKKAMLGVGVAVTRHGKTGSMASEFDLLSHEAFERLHVRCSVQGLPFEYWLPLPISWRHWMKVKGLVASSLFNISTAAKLDTSSQVKIIYHFMNNVLVKLNEFQATSKSGSSYPRGDTAKSTLTYASEKAIESYFHLFHLLLCLAVERPNIVTFANELLKSFLNGQTSKTACPNLGHLLVAALVSDIEIDDIAIKAIIKETVIRNVVWMLDPRGAGMSQLAYLEPSAVSEYRLEKSFEAGKTSYRLLMFLRLFQSVAVGRPRKPLIQLRDEAFNRHGAPPRGMAKSLADIIKRIHQVKDFHSFLANMGLKDLPSKTTFTKFLRDCIQASVDNGYSRMPYTQDQALALRRQAEPWVEVKAGVVKADWNSITMGLSFFPDNYSGGGRDGRGFNRGRRRGRVMRAGQGRGH